MAGNGHDGQALLGSYAAGPATTGSHNGEDTVVNHFRCTECSRHFRLGPKAYEKHQNADRPSGFSEYTAEYLYCPHCMCRHGVLGQMLAPLAARPLRRAVGHNVCAAGGAAHGGLQWHARRTRRRPAHGARRPSEVCMTGVCAACGARRTCAHGANLMSWDSCGVIVPPRPRPSPMWPAVELRAAYLVSDAHNRSHAAHLLQHCRGPRRCLVALGRPPSPMRRAAPS